MKSIGQKLWKLLSRILKKFETKILKIAQSDTVKKSC